MKRNGNWFIQKKQIYVLSPSFRSIITCFRYETKKKFYNLRNHDERKTVRLKVLNLAGAQRAARRKSAWPHGMCISLAYKKGLAPRRRAAQERKKAAAASRALAQNEKKKKERERERGEEREKKKTPGREREREKKLETRGEREGDTRARARDKEPKSLKSGVKSEKRDA